MPTRPGVRRGLAALSATLTAVTLAGCFGRQAPPPSSVDFDRPAAGTIHAWAFDSADDVGIARMKDAAAYLKGVHVVMDETPFDAQKFTTRLASGNVPDVVQMDRQYVGNYAAQRLIMPLDKCYAAGKVDPDQRFYDNVIGDVRYQGKVYGVPQFFQPPAIMLDERVMRAAGVSDAEIDTSKPDVLLAAIKKMYRSKGGNPTVLGFDPVATGQADLWMLGLGGHLMDATGRPTLDDPRNRYPLQLLKRIYDAQGGYARVKSFSDTFDVFGESNQYVRDQVGAQLNNQWYINVLAPFAKKIDIRTVPFRDRQGKPVTVTGGQSFAIPSRAKNPAAACAWMLRLTSTADWLAAGKARSATNKKSGGIDTGILTGSPEADRVLRAQTVRPTGNAGLDQTIAAYYSVVDDGISFGASPAGEAIEREIVNAITSVGLGDKTPQQALADAQGNAMQSYETATR